MPRVPGRTQEKKKKRGPRGMRPGQGSFSRGGGVGEGGGGTSPSCATYSPSVVSLRERGQFRPLKSPKLQVPDAQMTAITQQDMPQSETPKLQHIPTTKRASTSSTSCRSGSTRFSRVCARNGWLGRVRKRLALLRKHNPSAAVANDGTVPPKLRRGGGGGLSPLFLPAGFPPWNSPPAKFSHPLHWALDRPPCHRTMQCPSSPEGPPSRCLDPTISVSPSAAGCGGQGIKDPYGTNLR